MTASSCRSTAAAGCSRPSRPGSRRSLHRGHARWHPARRLCCGSACQPGGACLNVPEPRHQPPFTEVVAARLLHVHVLSRVQGKDRGGRVPVVGGRDPDSVDIEGRRGRGGGPSPPPGPCPSPFRRPPPPRPGGCRDIADVGDLNVTPGREQPKVMASHPPCPDQSNGDALLGRAPRQAAREGQSCGSLDAVLENRSAWDRSHGQAPQVGGWSRQTRAMIAHHCHELKKWDHLSTSHRAAHGRADDGQATPRLTEWRTLINNCVTRRLLLSEYGMMSDPGDEPPRPIRMALLIFALAGGSTCVRIVRAGEPIDYVRQVRPILKERCHACHGVLKSKAGLRLDTGRLLRRGGDGGAAIVPGVAGDSLLIDRVTEADPAYRMPPEGPPLTATQVDIIRGWIDQGAVSPVEERPEADPRTHWAFSGPDSSRGAQCSGRRSSSQPDRRLPREGL